MASNFFHTDSAGPSEFAISTSILSWASSNCSLSLSSFALSFKHELCKSGSLLVSFEILFLSILLTYSHPKPNRFDHFLTHIIVRSLRHMTRAYPPLCSALCMRVVLTRLKASVATIAPAIFQSALPAQ